jgi:hypothetical protein
MDQSWRPKPNAWNKSRRRLAVRIVSRDGSGLGAYVAYKLLNRSSKNTVDGCSEHEYRQGEVLHVLEKIEQRCR